jgi:copper(I)-binding protein
MPKRRRAGFVEPRLGVANRCHIRRNAYIVPLFAPGNCAVQVGDLAELRFTATNNRDTETERLLSIRTDAARTVRISPTASLDIPPNSSIAAGQPSGQGRPTSFDVAIDGLRDSAKPGTSVDVTFQFEKAGPLTIRTPVEACPRQDEAGQ